MKILLLALNHSPEKTGIGKYQGEMAAWLAARGHDVDAVVAPPYYPEWKIAAGHSAWRYKKETIDGVTVHRIPLYVPAHPSGLKRLVHLASFALMALPVALRLALRKKPDVVMMTAPPLMAAPVALWAARLAKARAIMHVQDFEVDAAFQLGLLKNQKMYGLALRLEKAALGAFDAVSTISPNMRRKLIEKGVKDDRAYLVPNWANTDMFSAAVGPGKWAALFKQDPATVLAVYSGNLGRKQGLETIVEAARLFEKKRPHIRFIISGDGAGRDDMIASASGLSNMTFLPVQPFEDFIPLMVATDIHLMPQKAGAADLVMPSKLGNILASGRPLVAGALEGTQVYEAVQGCGLAVPPEDAAAFAAAIETLADDAALRARMGQAGMARAKEDWSKESLLTRLETILASTRP